MKRIAKYILLLVVSGQWSVAGGQSVFSSGQWWKMSATTAGVYRVTPSDIPALAGASVDSLAVYGMGAGMLSTYNSETPTDGLRPTTTCSSTAKEPKNGATTAVCSGGPSHTTPTPARTTIT